MRLPSVVYIGKRGGSLTIKTVSGGVHKFVGLRKGHFLPVFVAEVFHKGTTCRGIQLLWTRDGVIVDVLNVPRSGWKSQEVCHDR